MPDHAEKKKSEKCGSLVNLIEPRIDRADLFSHFNLFYFFDVV